VHIDHPIIIYTYVFAGADTFVSETKRSPAHLRLACRPAIVVILICVDEITVAGAVFMSVVLCIRIHPF
jgi:hypothetical protein